VNHDERVLEMSLPKDLKSWKQALHLDKKVYGTRIQNPLKTIGKRSGK
jgi:hypothetical protein